MLIPLPENKCKHSDHQGADIIFHAAGATGLGVIEACQEAGVYAIGVDRDQYNDAPGTVITSAMKRVDTAVYDSVESLLNGTLEGAFIRMTWQQAA